MRTTLTLDDDIADKLKQLSHERRLPFREVVNEALRRGLFGQGPRRSKPKAFRLETFSSALRPGVDPMKLNQLVDELEAQRAREKLAR